MLLSSLSMLLNRQLRKYSTKEEYQIVIDVFVEVLSTSDWSDSDIMVILNNAAGESVDSDDIIDAYIIELEKNSE